MRRWIPALAVAAVAAGAALGAAVSQGAPAVGVGPRACTPIWKDAPSPRVQDGTLNGVVALSATNAWAVGGVTRYDAEWNIASAKPLVEHWDGARWSVAVTPRRGLLNDVAASSPTDVWAVGQPPDNGSDTGIVLHFDGRGWSQVAVPAAMPPLAGVTALSARDVWVVGETDEAGEAWHFDGKSWHRSRRVADAGLADVAASTKDDVWVVGSATGSRPLALHWDGARWRSFEYRETGVLSSGFKSVVVLASDDVWAAGSRNYEEMPAASYIPLVRRWDGKRWGAAGRPGGEADVYGITALSRGRLLAVGTNPRDYSIDGYGAYTWSWDGIRWQTHEGAPGRALFDVAALRNAVPPVGWAVGEIGSGQTADGYFPAHTIPLIRRYGC